MSELHSPHKKTEDDQFASYSTHSEYIFNAVKTLKQKDQHLLNISNRIKKLQLKQLKNLQKCENDQRLLQSLQKIKQQRDQQIQMINNHRIMIKSQTQEQHHKNSKQKSLKKQTHASVFTQIKNKRLSNYQFMKHKKQENQKKVIKIKQLDLDEKKRMRNRVVIDQKAMRDSRMHKLLDKKENIQKKNEKQIKEIKQKSKHQQNQIQKLARLQLELIQRNSQSQIRSNQIRERYQEYIKNQKLTLSSLRKKENEQNTYVHPLVKRIQKRMDKYNFQNAR